MLGGYRIYLAGEARQRPLRSRASTSSLIRMVGTRIGPLHVQIGVYRTPRQHFAGTLLGEGFQTRPIRGGNRIRRSKPFGVDRLQLPFERIWSTGAVTTGKNQSCSTAPIA